MASYNKIQLIGKLQDKPKITSTSDGISLSKFTVAVPRTESLPSEKFDHIPVTTWRENADKTASFNTNDILFIDGRILVKGLDDPTTGQKKWVTEVEARHVHRFSDVFSGMSSNEQSALPQNSQPAVETMSFQPVDDQSFFNDQQTTKSSDESKSNPIELEEDVPF